MADTKETSDGLRAEVARYVTKMASSKLPGPKINILSILRSSDGDLFAARVLLAYGGAYPDGVLITGLFFQHVAWISGDNSEAAMTDLNVAIQHVMRERLA
ncbi:MAG TPA: hypothetical protein DCX12_02800 [Chloroflexi bacterium]|jgi:hypothetical protein|nr:hypothetical protein [Chloroflexota bacterium]